VGYLVAIVVALVAPLLQGKGRIGRTTTTRLCCQRKDEGVRGREVPVGQAKAADCGKQ